MEWGESGRVLVFVVAKSFEQSLNVFFNHVYAVQISWKCVVNGLYEDQCVDLTFLYERIYVDIMVIWFYVSFRVFMIMVSHCRNANAWFMKDTYYTVAVGVVVILIYEGAGTVSKGINYRNV